MASITTFIAMLISLVFLTYCNIKNLYLIRVIFKTLTSLLFILIAYVTKREYSKKKTTTYYKLILLGLVFSLGGDVFLAIADNSKGILFVLGVASFAAAHIAYIFAFLQFDKISKLNIAWMGIFFVILIVLISIPNMFDFQGLKPLIIGYALLISFMVAKSFSLWKYRKQNPYFVYMTISSALFFLISDSILLFALFGDPSLSYCTAINNVIYYIGQALFGLSFKNELILDKKN